jgi:cytochrome c oxidase assembly protein subunit 15
MQSQETKINTFFLYWLKTSLLLIFSIIIVGGLTRLTNSGLSIIEWELFKGILPPLNDTSWNLYFEKYKTIPQYKLINSNMSLSEFKIIFYWEYFHRMLARLIGLFFIIPLIFFYYSKKIKKKYLYTCFIIFSLILLQGIIGWFMVKSGLVNDVTVSHYRLSVHLTVAIIIISMIFWLLLNIYNKKDKTFFKFSKYLFAYHFLIVIIFFQIIIGAFVSGLDAGKIYQSWPLMGNTYFPNDILLNNFYFIFDFDNHSLVQFYHRNLAYFIILYSFVLSIYVYTKKIKKLYWSLKILLLVLILQIIFGIVTLISGLNIYFASAHQILGVLLVFSAINLYYFRSK